MGAARWIVIVIVLADAAVDVFGQRDTANETTENNARYVANIFKCSCQINEALSRNGECVPASNPVPVWDFIKQEYLVVEISNFSNVAVHSLVCGEGYSILNLNVSQFLIYTNGFLDNLVLVDDPPTSTYCIDHLMEPSGITLLARVCTANPVVPLCCPLGHKLTNWNCVLENNIPFRPRLMGEFSWTGYNFTEQRIDCSEGAIIHSERVTFPDELGASLVSYPLGVQLQWNSLFNNFPRFMTYNQYCIAMKLSQDEWFYIANFCIPDPKLEHIEQCQNATCLRKCCPYGAIFNKMYKTCVLYSHQEVNYQFVDSDGQTLEEPENITLVFGPPFCEELYFLSDVLDEELDVLSFDIEGDLVSKSGKHYSAFNYCVDRITDNFTSMNSSLQNNAIVCLKGFTATCPWRWIVSGVLLGISCIFYLLILIVYLGIEDLRSKMVGKCLISEVASLLIAYVILIFLQNSDSYYGPMCNIPGAVEHISILASFFWLNIMCYDMWSKIRKMKVAKEKTRSRSKKFIAYCAYGWGVPLMIGIIRVVIDLLPENYDPWWLVKSKLGKTHCFFSSHFSDSLAKWLYLYCPILALLLLNLAFFIHVAFIIRTTEKESAKIMGGSESGKTRKNINAKKERALLYLRLFLVMGISWMLEIIMWVAVPENDCHFWALDIINMFQGVFIFAIFVCKKETLQKVKDRFGIQTPRQVPTRDEIPLTEPRRTESRKDETTRL